MNALFYSFLAASTASFNNWLFRKNSTKSESEGGEEKKATSVNGYLFFFYLFSFATSLVINMDVWSSALSPTMLTMGAIVGVLNITMMLLTAKAMNNGPAGLTFAFQNASAVFPGILLFLFLGAAYGFTFSYRQLAGILLVLAGLFVGTQTKSDDSSQASKPISMTWLKYALGCLIVQVLALTLMQGRCVLFECSPTSPFAAFKVMKSEDMWFMPGFFFTTVLLQGLIFASERRGIQRGEMVYGTVAGVVNCISTGLLLMATKTATASEQGILFPLFAVSTIVICNLWATMLYKEKFNYASNGLCALGIFIGL